MKYISIIILSLLISCSAYKHIEPVGKDKMTVNLDFGGPIVEAFNTNIPVPYLSIGGNYGLEEKIDVSANLHVMPLFYCLSGLDLGITYYPVINQGYTPTISLNANLMIFNSLKSNVDSRTRIYPIITPSFAWQLGGGKIYTGTHLITPLSKLDYKENAPLLLSPFIGYKWNISNNYNLYSEIKWQGANIYSDNTTVTYTNISKNGALGVYFTIEKGL